MFIGRANAEAEAPTLWPPDQRINFLEKTLMLGKTKAKEKEVTEDEMAGWHH